MASSAVHVKLQEAYGGSGVPLILDVRSPEAFFACHLLGACNIPEAHLLKRLFLLPDKPQGFVVVEPQAASPSDGAAAQGAPPAADADGAATEGHGHLRGHPCASAFLVASGWTVLFSLQPDGATWEAAAELGVLRTGTGSSSNGDVETIVRWLFSPAKLLLQEVDQIERSLVERLRASGPMPSSVTWRALDVGCGSGRDLAWLAGRRALVQQPEASCNVRWAVSGVDEWFGALARAQEVLQVLQADDAAAPPEADLHFAAIDTQSGTLKQLPLPTKGKDARVLNSGTQFISRLGPPAAHGAYELVLFVRILERAFLPHAAQLLAPGGFILYCTFMDMPGTQLFGRPQAPRLLHTSELATHFFGPAQGFHVLRDGFDVLPDGREVSMFVARKQSANAQ